MKDKFEFDRDEKVNKVEGHLIQHTMVLPNGTNLTMLIIIGIVFSTTKDRASPSYNGRSDEVFSEEFDGYTLGYVTGKSSEYIEQLQFFWYRRHRLTIMANNHNAYLYASSIIRT